MRGGWLRVLLARASAYRAVMLVAWLVILATVTLFAASAIYAEAVGRSGLAARLARSSVIEGNLQVRLVMTADHAAAADELVRDHIEAALGSEGVAIHHLARGDSYSLPADVAQGDLAVVGYAQGLPEQARLVSGAWPRAGQQPLQTALSVAAAERLGLALDERLTLVSRRDATRQVEVQVVGIFEPLDPGAPFWWQDPLELDGVSVVGSFTSYGPFYLERDDLLAAGASGTSLTLIWRAEPNVAAIDGANIGSIAARVRALPGRLETAFERTTVNVETGLPQVLAAAAGSLLVSRAGILLLDLQLGLLGIYALVMLSALILDQRRADTALLRSRGASLGQLTGLGVAEGVLLVLPAIAIAPWLALLLVGAFDSIGPLADIGVVIAPRLTAEGIALAAAGGGVALIGLSLPMLAASGPIASVRRMVGRQLQRTAAHRFGLDIALLVLAGVALWQLNQYGTPLTRSLRGSLGVDPLLVAAPMVGLLAGALVSLRLFPILAGLAERALAARRGPALGVRQLARRPLNYTRAAMLLIVAAAVTVFAGAYGATSVVSQHDQVAHAVGADARLTDAPRLTPAEVDAAFAALEDVEAAAPVVRGSFQLGARSSRGELLALGVADRSALVTFRPDLAGAPLAEMLAVLRPPATTGVALPMAAQQLTAQLAVALAPVAGAGEPLPADWQGITASAVVVEESGLMHVVPGDGSLGAQGGEISFALPRHAGLTGTPAALTLAALEVSVRVPVTSALHGSIVLGELWTSSTDSAAQRQPLTTDYTAWQTARLSQTAPPSAVDPAEMLPSGVAILPEVPLPAGSRATYSLRAPGVRSSDDQPLPALVNPVFLADAGVELEDRVSVAPPFSTARAVTPVAVVRAFPTLAADAPLAVVDLVALAMSDYAALGRLPEPTEFWLDTTAAADRGTLERQLTGNPLAAADLFVASDALAERLTDPLAVGTTGALLIGTVGALLFAVVGFLTNATIGVRERMVEFGLLRSVGVSRRQLITGLAVESSLLLGASLVVGTLLGMALAIVALPTATVTEQGAAPVPPAIPVWPAEPLIVLLGLALALLLAALALFARSLAADELSSLLRVRAE